MKDIIYDLIQSKLKIKELEDKLLQLQTENTNLINVNSKLTNEVSKWKTHITHYIDDYRNLYLKSSDINNYNDITSDDMSDITNIEHTNDIKEDKNEIIYPKDIKEEKKPDDIKVDNIKVIVDNINNDTTKSRNEYMKEYMRNKRKQQKEELKKVIVNKK